MTQITYWGVYRVMADGSHRYVSRSATTSEKLARELAVDYTEGRMTLPTGKVVDIKSFPHIAKRITK